MFLHCLYFFPAPAATPAAENSTPATLATSSTRFSAGLSRSICFSISCCRLSGASLLRLSLPPGVSTAHHPREPPWVTIVHEVDHEERIAFGALVNQMRQFVEGRRDKTLPLPCPLTQAKGAKSRSRYSATCSSVRKVSGSSLHCSCSCSSCLTALSE